MTRTEGLLMAKGFAAVLALLFAGAGLAQPADVALVNLVAGSVSFTAIGAPPAQAVRPFMKLREGDRIEVASGGEVGVVFLASGRQERWVGPAAFRAAKDAGVPAAGMPAQVTQLPAVVAQRIARVPELMQNAKLAGLQVRGLPPAAKGSGPEQPIALAEARALYASLRQDAAAGDITPELFLYAALHELRLYEEMNAAVEEMLRRQPDNDDVKALARWVRGRTGR